MRESSWAVGARSARPSSWMRTVVAPTNDATFGATPRRSRYSRYSPRVVHSTAYFEIALLLDLLQLHGVVEGTHRAALAEHLQRDALPDVAFAAAVHDQRLVGPAQHVDEAGRHRQAASVDLQLPSRATEIAHRGKAVAVDGEIADDRRSTGAVMDRAAANHDVVACGGELGRVSLTRAAGRPQHDSTDDRAVERAAQGQAPLRPENFRRQREVLRAVLHLDQTAGRSAAGRARRLSRSRLDRCPLRDARRPLRAPLRGLRDFDPSIR